MPAIHAVGYPVVLSSQTQTDRALANIVFTWELGSGLGHVGPFYPIAQQLIERGHRITLLVRDRKRTERLFHDLPVQIIDAPLKPELNIERITPPVTLTDILYNQGWCDLTVLSAQVSQWSDKIRACQPDLLIADHSPTALLAAREFDIPRIHIGTGFTCPPDISPLPPMCSWRTAEPEVIVKREQAMVGVVNQVLEKRGLSTIDSMAQIFNQVDHLFLATFAELDHYPQRTVSNYIGTWPFLPRENLSSSANLWPPGDGPKVFAYLKPSPSIGHLLDWLAKQKLPTLVVGDGLNIDALVKVSNSTIRFSRTPVDLSEVGQQCSVAIANGTHGTTCSLLLTGTPILQLPRNLEQTITAVNTVKLGAGLDADINNPQQIIRQLSGLLSDEKYQKAARQFAEKYQEHSAEQRIAEVVSVLQSAIHN